MAIIGKAGLGTPHMDGNTRLCTATAAAALKETFGSDGQPGSYEDIDVTDCILHVGHNIAATDTVLWMRVLDRRAAPNPPKLIVIDPRETPTAKEADLHLAPKLGTNLALLNGLQHLLIHGGHVDRAFIDQHTIGYDVLAEIVVPLSARTRRGNSRACRLTDLRRAAEMIGQSRGLVSSCLQGIYQSNQATAAACQVNNINLILGRIGTPGMRHPANERPAHRAEHPRDAEPTATCRASATGPTRIISSNSPASGTSSPTSFPHWAPPTHAMEIFRLCETGSIRMLWIQATNPAVSMPDLGRIRRILQKDDLFVVAQDGFMTETTRACRCGAAGGDLGREDRLHAPMSAGPSIFSHKAVEPPGEARADLDIFLDYARRMDFRDKDGAPLIKWSDAEGAFDGWRECTRGRPCDYTGLSYAKLTGGSGIPWPCNEDHPEGSPRFYTDLKFATDPDDCEHYGSDLDTGAPWNEQKFRALEPNGRAILKGTDYLPPTEEPDEEYPFFLTTGRLVYHFHTRTRTGRARALQEAAPDDFVQIGH